jgi:hypothetical protein
MKKHLRAGQSFVELLIGIAVGAIFMVGASMIIAPSLSENGQATKVQTAANNADALINNVRVWSEGGWGNVLSIATGSSYQYYLITSSSPYVATSGVQTIVVATTTYTQYFYVSDVYRTITGDISLSPAGNTYDPSTKQISVLYNWTNGKPETMTTYITRNDDEAFIQDDWSGGPNATTATTSVGNQFASSTNIDYTTSTGSIFVSIPGY